MKSVIYFALLAAVLALSACSGNKFKIKAQINGLGNMNVRTVWMGAQGVSDAYITAQDGKFELEGTTADVTVVSILDAQNKPMFRVAVGPSETVEVSGDYNNPHHYRCKGNDDAQAWMEFESKYATLYGQADATPLDQAIEKYVKENPKSLVSTLLLVIDYSDAVKALGLLEKLEASVRPASLCEGLERLNAATSRTRDVLGSMMLCALDGDFEAVNASPDGVSLFYLWNDSRSERKFDIQTIKDLSKRWGKRLTVADVSLMPDTLGWRAALRADSSSWKHYWAPGSILDPAVEPLHITKLPFTVVADSTGHIVYRGNDIKAAAASVDKRHK